MSYHLSARYLALWNTLWYIRPGYCIMFIKKKLDEGLTSQLIEQKPLISPRLYMYLVAKIKTRRPRSPNCQFIVKYCSTSVLLYAKLQKETEKNIGCYCHIFIIGVISIGAGLAPCPLWLRLCLSSGTLILCDTVNPNLIVALSS